LKKTPRRKDGKGYMKLEGKVSYIYYTEKNATFSKRTKLDIPRSETRRHTQPGTSHETKKKGWNLKGQKGNSQET